MSGGEVDRILALLGVDGAPPPTAAPPKATLGDIAGFRIVTGNNSSWIEMEGDRDGVFRVARPKARMLLHLLPEISKWAKGEKPRGRSDDCEWRMVHRHGEEMLEIQISHWKPIRISRST